VPYISNIQRYGARFGFCEITNEGSLIISLTRRQVRTFLNLLPSSEGDKEKFAVDQPLEVVGISATLSPD